MSTRPALRSITYCLPNFISSSFLLLCNTGEKRLLSMYSKTAKNTPCRCASLVWKMNRVIIKSFMVIIGGCKSFSFIFFLYLQVVMKTHFSLGVVIRSNPSQIGWLLFFKIQERVNNTREGTKTMTLLVCITFLHVSPNCHTK